VEKKEITLAEVLNLTGPGQLLTLTDEDQLINKGDCFYRGNKAKLKRNDLYRGVSGRIVKHISTISDDMAGKRERGIEIVLRS
jgi:hypothetical protein